MENCPFIDDLTIFTITICSYQKWFSIATLNYQMVSGWLCKIGLIWGLGLGPMATAQDPRYRKRPPLRMASVDQGYANRVGFPSSLSLEPNGHISASCHCHPLSIRSGLAPSSQLLRPKLHARSALLRRHWTICLTPGQWCAECPRVTVVCLDALWVRRTGRKSRQVRRHHLSGQAVWACLWKNHVYFASHNNQTNAVHAACGIVETNRNTFPHPNPIVETKYTYTLPSW